MPIPTCCVLIPVGPGHLTLAQEACASVERAAGFSRGPFETVVVAFLDDTSGSFGRSRRRNDGVAYALEQGFDWVFFLDADDLMAQNAFTEATTYISDHDAIWGAIWETRDGCVATLRPEQVMPIRNLSDVLSNDPFLTLQMGHFVRTEVAKEIPFDIEMNCGEDFKYYLEVWRRYRCIKIDRPLFFNRRGCHSTGPRSANGRQWRTAVEEVIRDTIAKTAFASLPSETRRRRSEELIAGGNSDVARWGNLDNFSSAWSSRAVIAGRLIDPSSRVLDIGCGCMEMEKALPEGAVYLPADLLPRDRRTVVCDLNRLDFPNVDANVGVMLGVLEYLHDPARVLAELAVRLPRLILSYHPADLDHGRDRLAHGWVNRLSSADLVKLASEAGYALHAVMALDVTQRLYDFGWETGQR